MPLTNTAIKNAKPAKKTTKLFDERGLYLEVSPRGGKWWRFKYRLNGKEKRLSLGVYPDVTLKMARERRDNARKLLADGIALQVGLSKVRGAAKLGDLTAAERKNIDDAKAEKEKLAKELSDFDDSAASLLDSPLAAATGAGALAGLLLGPSRGREEINKDIQRQQAKIDAANKAGLARGAAPTARTEPRRIAFVQRPDEMVYRQYGPCFSIQPAPAADISFWAWSISDSLHPLLISTETMARPSNPRSVAPRMYSFKAALLDAAPRTAATPFRNASFVPVRS